jgi:uncharacterized protein (DUF1697 family)
MAHVVFLRAANVGGNNVFRPAQVAAALAHLEAVNIGAAGTFVIRGKTSVATIRREILSRLPFALEITVRPAAEVRALVDSRPFEGVEFSRDLRGWVAPLCGRPKRQPTLPLILPKGKPWCCRFERMHGTYAIGLWQRRPKGFVIPANVVESAVGVPATARWWETFERIVKALDA